MKGKRSGGISREAITEWMKEWMKKTPTSAALCERASRTGPRSPAPFGKRSFSNKQKIPGLIPAETPIPLHQASKSAKSNTLSYSLWHRVMKEMSKSNAQFMTLHINMFRTTSRSSSDTLCLQRSNIIYTYAALRFHLCHRVCFTAGYRVWTWIMPAKWHPQLVRATSYCYCRRHR